MICEKLGHSIHFELISDDGKLKSERERWRRNLGNVWRKRGPIWENGSSLLQYKIPTDPIQTANMSEKSISNWCVVCMCASVFIFNFLFKEIIELIFTQKFEKFIANIEWAEFKPNFDHQNALIRKPKFSFYCIVFFIHLLLTFHFLPFESPFR